MDDADLPRAATLTYVPIKRPASRDAHRRVTGDALLGASCCRADGFAIMRQKSA
ncbi:Hypothetical protein CAP_7017 [Chondromyces apiculatus DSM 436]|uniref:Uncharacterized protein n=1 Tax=Chondromyces apiculatus DSM 436 TaxID=1192034 RepID=A0A017TGQ4_9BACT|nr:Hypothetical protein CAP_7017 [Chondromyces apiculatus DSM 436]